MVYNLLQQSQSASAAVEKRSSLLIKLLAKNSKFKHVNIARYLSVYFNASKIQLPVYLLSANTILIISIVLSLRYTQTKYTGKYTGKIYKPLLYYTLYDPIVI